MKRFIRVFTVCTNLLVFLSTIITELLAVYKYRRIFLMYPFISLNKLSKKILYLYLRFKNELYLGSKPFDQVIMILYVLKCFVNNSGFVWRGGH